MRGLRGDEPDDEPGDDGQDRVLGHRAILTRCQIIYAFSLYAVILFEEWTLSRIRTVQVLVGALRFSPVVSPFSMSST